MNRRDEGPSRSARKRASEALQALGERLVALGDAELAQIPLPEELAAAVQEARRIRERGGRRRQLQFIGKLMRRIDARPIEQAVAALDAAQREENESFHRAEQWRDRLLREGTAALNALQEERPGLDTAHLSRLLQDAAAEKGAHHPPHAARLLFRYLRDVVFAKSP